MNSCDFVGRMTRDAEDIGTTGEAVKFTIAVDGYDYSTKSKKTTFVDVVAFGKVVNTIKQYAGQGHEVGVNAEYQRREYTPTSGPGAGIKRWEHNFVVQRFWLLAGKPAGSGQFQGSQPNMVSSVDPSGSEEPVKGW